MGRVEAFRLPGLDLFILSSDHLPPHIHVNKPGEWTICVYFLECTEKHLEFRIKWARTKRILTMGQRSALLGAIIEHRDLLLAEWERKVCRD